MPFYCLTNPLFARNTLVYRINTLNGAKQKAKKYGFEITKQEAEAYLAELENCELNAADLDNVAGGLCYGVGFAHL